jgi:hypothetical protein
MQKALEPDIDVLSEDNTAWLALLSTKNLIDAHKLFRTGNRQQLQRNSIQYRKNTRIHPDA